MRKLFFLLSLIAFFYACNQEIEPIALPKPTQTVELTMGGDSVIAFEVAKEIIYDVKLRVSSDDEEWTRNCLKNTSPEALGNSIFKAIYEERLIAYDYFTDEKMSIKAVQKFEKEFERIRIGQLQFIEDWYFDEQNLKFYKEVKGLMMAYERYREDGSVKNYKAGIKVFFE
ncbi:MAG: hypothetical protein KAI79_16755 [Bacteroidales bacterium]|nr:hypothetical protein [Bacteroidales bacterium]